VRKTFKYRIYPSKRQKRLLKATLEECRWLYNELLAQRRDSWQNHQKSLTLYGQQSTYQQLKATRSSLRSVHSQVLQNVAVRIDLALKAFFRRVKTGEKPGYPRFRGKDRYDSFTFPQSGFKVISEKSLVRLSKIGSVKIILHRPVEGEIKTCTVRRTATDKWFVCFSCAWEPTALPENTDEIGLDLGIRKFATMSDGRQINNPRFFKTEERALARSQRKLAKQTKGTPERERARRVIARVYERLRWKRDNFVHQHSRRLVDRYGFIAIEDLEVNRMVHNKCFAKSILDVAWSQFSSLLSIKAEWASRKVVRVNPAYTSQTCSACGHRQTIPLSQTVFDCLCCGLKLDRDHNAAKNILALGRQCLAKA